MSVEILPSNNCLSSVAKTLKYVTRPYAPVFNDKTSQYLYRKPRGRHNNAISSICYLALDIQCTHYVTICCCWVRLHPCQLSVTKENAIKPDGQGAQGKKGDHAVLSWEYRYHSGRSCPVFGPGRGFSPRRAP